MKTTIEISDALLREAKQVAAREGTTVRALVEEGLRHVLRGRQRREGFRLRKESFKGEGLHPEVAGGSWERIRELIYQGRGT
ncbi:MAG TPA: type II toxin-antitoxin system VapB family antitoxin [Vicinamibacterales bacterium]|nr:type II toxin-antitoxin system VapB family antitoxin [Vicinamibacterales bacterium]